MGGIRTTAICAILAATLTPLLQQPASAASADSRTFNSPLGALSQLDANPGDRDALARLDDAVANLRRMQRSARNLDAAEREAIVRKSYRKLLAGVENQAVQNLFSQGLDAMDRDLWLSATERFSLCRLAGPQEPWLLDALDDYLTVQLPSKILSEGQKRPGGSAYQKAGAALAKSDVDEANRRLESYLADLSAAPGSVGVGQAKDEATRLLSRMQARLKLTGAAPDEIGRTLEMMRAAEESPEAAIEKFEDELYRFGLRKSPLWRQKNVEALHWAYVNLGIEKALAKAAKADENGDMKAAFKIIVSVLQISPRNPKAFYFLDQIQKRSREGNRASGGLDDAPRPAAEGAVEKTAPARISEPLSRTETPAPARPADAQRSAQAPVAAEPVDIASAAQAEAYYNRGLSAYLKGQIPQAIGEFQQSLKFNPDNERVRKALQRSLREVQERP